MALSDLLLRLGHQAKDLEATATAIHAENETDLVARETELRNSLAQVKSSLDKTVEAGSEVAGSRLAELQRTVSDGFESLRAAGAARSKSDAEQAIAFAVHALQEAEYYVLAASANDDDVIAAPTGIEDVAAVPSTAAAKTESARKANVAPKTKSMPKAQQSSTAAAAARKTAPPENSATLAAGPTVHSANEG